MNDGSNYDVPSWWMMIAIIIFAMINTKPKAGDREKGHHHNSKSLGVCWDENAG